MNERWIRIAVSVLLISTLSGCHLLVRLGDDALTVQRHEPLPVSIPEPMPDSSVPVSPILDAPPPAPGLDDDRGDDEVAPPLPPGLGGLSLHSANPEINLIASSSLPDRSPSIARSSRSRFQDTHFSPRDLWKIRRQISGNTGINTNTAIAPGEGQFIYRTQLRFLRSQTTPVPPDIDVNLLVNPQVLAYGVRENLTLFGVVPLIKRDGVVRPPDGSVNELEEFGIGDMRFFAKYRIGEVDQPGETTRLSLFGGLEVPSYDKNFSSRSWDPFLGTVWTYQSLEWGLDLDWFWNFNTGRELFRHDEMRYDLAYTYVLLTGQNLDDRFWQLNSIFEINGSYLTDNSHVVYAAPGFQLALERMIVEASFQLPVVREVRNGIEPDYTFVIGTRITW